MKPILSPRFAIYLVSALGSGCGFVVQTLVSGFWSTAYSQDVFHFSVNLAFYFLSMGVGSLLSERWKRPRWESLVTLALALALWTALAIPLLRLGIAVFGGAPALPIAVVSVAGALAGFLVPIALRVGRKVKGISLPVLFFLDYTAAIAFTALFTFVLLVPLGYGKTALIASFFCLLLLIPALLQPIRWTRTLVVLIVGAWLLPFPANELGLRVGQWMKDPRDPTEVVIDRQSHYQKIVLTKEKGTGSFFPGMQQHVLYLDGMVQFTSLDEQSYHACIANIPEAAAEYNGRPATRALILGGGDGLAARNLLSIPRIKSVTQVEIDPLMLDLARNHPVLRSYNLDSLRSSRIELVVDDAFQWVKKAKEPYDLILIDFPHPRNVTLARLFTAEFYANVKKILSPKGFVAVQAGPSIGLEDKSLGTLSAIPVAIRETMRSVGFNASIYASPRDEEAFVLATPDPGFRMADFAKTIGIVGLEGMGLVCTFNPEWKEPKVALNTLNTLTLANYMLEWYRKAGPFFFNYRGVQSVFLPN